MSRYVRQGVAALHSQISAQLGDKLDDIESEDELEAGALPDPVDILDFHAPADTRSPLVQVYGIGFQPHGEDGQRHGLYDVACRVELALAFDADVSAGEEKTLRYTDALMRSVLHDAVLGGSAIQCMFTGAQAAMELDDATPTRNIWSFDFDVTVQSEAGG